MKREKILHEPNLRVTATTVRVPVSNSHSESINVELENNFELPELVETLNNFTNLIVVDNPEKENILWLLMLLDMTKFCW